jgi:beta-galactosidase
MPRAESGLTTKEPNHMRHAFLPRNRFTRTVLVAAMAAALAAGCGGDDDNGTPDTPGVSLEAVRAVTPLDRGWRFVLDEGLSDEQALSANSSNWSSVTLPHTWNATDAASTAQSTPSTPTYERSVGWYQLEFDGGAASAGTKWLQFDAASITADIWLNGVKLGQHRGAFTAFRFNVTDVLKPGKNLLVVKTDNRQARADGDPNAIAPLSGDFNMSGGLYRGVSLINTPDKAHIALGDLGGPGVYAKTTSITGTNAVVNVAAKLENAVAAGGTYTVTASLLDAEGKTVKQSVSSPVTLKPGEAITVSQDLAIADARLWQGLSDPYLHKLVVELKNSAGTSLDKVVQDFGIREMRFDPNLGFFLNGRSVPLHGVNMHQDMLGKAWAISEEDSQRSFELIKEVGANTLRMAHYPHSDYAVQQADKLGLIVMAELPLVNATSVTRLADPETTGFAANARLQLQELIRQKFNNASVGIWSVGNEVQGGTDAQNNVKAMFQSLHDTAKLEDPSRITSLANQINRSGDVIRPDAITLTGVTDSFSVNRYFQWYYGQSETQLGDNLDQIHADSPGQPIGVTEYGAGSGLTHHTDNVRAGRVCSSDTSGSTRICYQPEGYANYVHEKAYEQMVQRPYLMGTWIWNMFDFGSGNRHEGDIGQTNTKGIVTFGRDTKKDVFFFYKANWSQGPVTYIAERRHTERVYQTAQVKVYSNAASVALLVNGVEVARKSAADCPVKVCNFGEVPLAAGVNTISAVGDHAGQSVTDFVNWTLSAKNAANVYIAAGQLASGFVSNDPLLGNNVYGSDNYFLNGDLPPLSGRSTVGLSGAVAINGLGTTVIPETGRVWDMWREGPDFTYDIPVANGSYRVTMGFLEPTATAVGARVFNVNAEGATVLPNVDIFQSTGAIRTATARSFTVNVVDGRLTLNFVGVQGRAIVSNIAVERL